MSGKTERRRHEALAREMGAWTSWVVGNWFSTGAMAMMVDPPFQAGDMLLEYDCSCSADARYAHLADLGRPCVYVDYYGLDAGFGDRLTQALQTSMACQGNALAVIEREAFTLDDGPACYRARVADEDDPLAWVAVQTRYVEAIERHARPDRWAWFSLPDHDDGRPRAPVIWALRGKQAVACISPVLCPGSACQLATPGLKA